MPELAPAIKQALTEILQFGRTSANYEDAAVQSGYARWARDYSKLTLTTKGRERLYRG